MQHSKDYCQYDYDAAASESVPYVIYVLDTRARNLSLLPEMYQEDSNFLQHTEELNHKVPEGERKHLSINNFWL